MSENTTSNNRRTVLKTLAAIGTAAFAGCSSVPGQSGGSEETETPTPEQASGEVNDTSVSGTTLTVGLGDSEKVGVLKALNPDGSLWKQKPVERQSSVDFDLFSSSAYTPGRLQIIAEDDEGTSVGEAKTEPLVPKLEPLEIGIAGHRPDLNWDKGIGWEKKVYVTVTNTGTGPERVDQLQFYDVPGTTENDGQPDIQGGPVPILPGQKVTLQSEPSVFGIPSNTEMGYIACNDQGFPHEFTTTLQGAVSGEKSFTATIDGQVNTNKLDAFDDKEDVKLYQKACEVDEVVLATDSGEGQVTANGGTQG